MSNEEKTLDSTAVEDKKRLNLLKILWPATELGGGFNKAYFSIYVSYLYTNVYMMSVAFSSMLSLVQLVIGWVGQPIFATFLDRFSFKKAKYFPWISIGSIVVYACWMLIFALPAVGVSGASVGVVAFVLACTISISGPMNTAPISAVYPQLSADPADRQFFARWQKIGRDGGKTVFGLIVPIMLAYFTASMGDTNAYAILGLIIGLITIMFYQALAWFGLRGSYVERNAVARDRTATGEKKKGLSLGQVLKTVGTNRPLLSMYLFMSIHKGYYFIYTSAAMYIFTYVFKNMMYMATFMFVFNLLAIIGVTFGSLWKMIFKETKRCFVSCMAVHVALLLVIAIFFNRISAPTFIFLFGASSFFMGLLENYVMPMFAASADYGAWKSGNRLDGLTMSIYSLSITTGSLISTLARSAFLIAVGLDAVIADPTLADAAFAAKMGNLFSWVPFAMGVVSLLFLNFGFNLNDTRIANINADIKNGVRQAESANKF